MAWHSVRTTLASILNTLDTAVSDVQRDQDEFIPLLRIHPPAFRKTRRETIDKHSENISAVWEQILLIEARVLELKEEIKRRRTLHLVTARSPVFALPEEILRDVFLYMWTDDREAQQASHYINLVCRHWRAIAAHLEPVSSHVTLPHSRNINPIIYKLRASSPHPVHLTIEAPETKDFPVLAASNLGRRLESLAWNTGEDLRMFLLKLASNTDVGYLESLQTLAVKGPNRCPSCRAGGTVTWPSISLSKLGGLPQLADLNLKKAALERCLVSNTLTSLTLCSCSVRSLDIVQSIHGAPNLQYLSISEMESIGSTASFWDTFTTPTVFVHHSLQKIVLSQITGNAGWSPLYYGRYPNLRSLSVRRLSPGTRVTDNAGSWLPPQTGELGPLERSFYHTVSDGLLRSISIEEAKYPLTKQMLASQGLESLELELSLSLLRDLCGSLNSRPEIHDPEFPRVFPPPRLANLEISIQTAHSSTARLAEAPKFGEAILKALQIRQLRLHIVRDQRKSGFTTLKISTFLLHDLQDHDWDGLVNGDGVISPDGTPSRTLEPVL